MGVLIIGLGTVGAPFAEMLAQQGAELVLCDPDRVEARNLRTQPFDLEHVGKPKVFAVAEVIRRRDPDASLELIEHDIRHVGIGFLIDRRIDLVAACVDNRAAERYCSRLANLAGAGFVRLATRGATRTVDVTLIPAAKSEHEPCGICTYTLRDHRVADRREGCASELENNPDAAALTWPEQGRLAASLAIDSIWHDGLEPARLLRFSGKGDGTSKNGPSLNRSLLSWSRSCQLSQSVGGHGPGAWRPLAPECAVGDIVSVAERELGTRPLDLLVEADVPLCLMRRCEACGADAGPAFRIFSRLVSCLGCGGTVRQEVLPAQRRFGLGELAAHSDRRLCDLDPPLGLGLRIASPERTLDLYASSP